MEYYNNLTKPLKSYFYIGSTEWNDIDDNERFMDFTLAFNKGCNLYETLDDYINEYGSFGEENAKSALCRFIAVLRYNKSNQRDIGLTQLILENNLGLKELTELFRVELLLRCSYLTDRNGKQIFSRKFISGEPVYLYINRNKKSTNSIKEIVCHPTGYKEINKNWLIENNPWRTLAQEYQGYDLYSTTRTFTVESDKELLELYNNTKKNDNHKYHLEIPAEPWQGNPLTAKIIILSLNPGWKEKYNKEIALEISKKSNIAEAVFKEKQRTLLFEAEGFFPYDKKIVDAISLIGENYWRGDDKKAGRLSVLKPDTMDEFDFYKKFAVVQYCGYTSKEYGGGFDNGKYLPTQIYTKELIRYIAYNRPDVKFVILRAEDKWKNLLDTDVWETMLPNTIIAKYPIQQRLSKTNLGEDKFEELMSIIKE